MDKPALIVNRNYELNNSNNIINDNNMIRKTLSRTNRGMNDKLLLISNLIGCSLLLLLALILLSNSLASCSEVAEQDFEELGLHYGKYLKEVVAALDKDQKFTETIKNMDANDIKSGKVAEQLKHVHEDVRKKLNDLKYLEIKRLRDLATRKNEMEQYGETYHGSDKRKWRTLGASLSQLPEHLGSHGTYFDMNDLHKLMVAATNDLEKIDKERREDYKTYEMEKEWQFEQRLKMMNETEKQEAIKLRKQLKEKHDDHPKVHEPGTKQQFEEVWEKKDHLPKAEFDPRTFFNLHDTNSDNHWDQEEVRQLLVTEISKLYDPNNPEDDPNEMEEEYERMREHIYQEIDANKDGLIAMQEFLDYSKKPDFKNDHGWDDVTKKEAFSKQDYEKYMSEREKMLSGMHGHYQPNMYANQPNNLHLPNWGLGMPAGVHPSQYYGYQVDPNHPQAQQILAQQQIAYQQQAAYHQQAAYQQPGVVPQQGYHQPHVNPPYYQTPASQQNQPMAPGQLAAPVNYQQASQAAPAQAAGQPPAQQPNQQYFGAPAAIQNNQYQQKPPVPQSAQASFQQQQQPQQQQQQQPQQQQQQPPQQQQQPPQQQQQQPRQAVPSQQAAPPQQPAASFQPPVQQQQNYQPVK